MSLDTGAGPDEAVSAEAGADIDEAFQAAGADPRDPGLGLLLELAKRGEYDPWDVDIVALTDRYLQALDQHLDARDLGQVARLIFYAAALVHLKAQVLAEREARLRQSEQQALEADMAALIANGLERAGSAFAPGLPEFIARRVTRCYETVDRAVGALNAESLASGRKLTIAAARSVLGSVGLMRPDMAAEDDVDEGAEKRG